MIIVTMVRCATGEAWPDIMLAGIGGRPCDPKSYNRFVLFELKMLKEVKIYFFNILRQGILSKYCRVVLTLVPTLLIPVSQEFNHRWVDRPGPDLWLGRLLRLLRLLHLLLLLHHDQPLCRRHHGQLWLPDKVWNNQVEGVSLLYALLLSNRDSSILGSHHLGEFITSWAEIDPSGV